MARFIMCSFVLGDWGRDEPPTSSPPAPHRAPWPSCGWHDHATRMRERAAPRHARAPYLCPLYVTPAGSTLPRLRGTCPALAGGAPSQPVLPCARAGGCCPARDSPPDVSTRDGTQRSVSPTNVEPGAALRGCTRLIAAPVWRGGSSCFDEPYDAVYSIWIAAELY